MPLRHRWPLQPLQLASNSIVDGRLERYRQIEGVASICLLAPLIERTGRTNRALDPGGVNGQPREPPMIPLPLVASLTTSSGLEWAPGIGPLEWPGEHLVEVIDKRQQFRAEILHRRETATTDDL